jgi:2-polyprenyl-6-hydroxyphenyl methylase/3-demethylubiquinone-9 3-methyltransferase
MNDLTIYDTWAPRWWDGSARWLRTLHNMVPARLAYFETVISSWDGLNVLDLGCGGGFMSDALAQRGAKVIGVDPSVEAIGAARRHAAVRHFDIDYRIGVGESKTKSELSCWNELFCAEQPRSERACARVDGG